MIPYNVLTRDTTMSFSDIKIYFSYPKIYLVS